MLYLPTHKSVYNRTIRQTIVFGIISLLGLPAIGGERVPAIKEDVEPIAYALVITGSELLAGVYPDRHTHFITRALNPLGFHCETSVTVGDTRESLESALDYVGGRVKLVIVTGGLGPTEDDITRETLSHHTGIPLRQHPAIVEKLEDRFSRPIREQENLLRQTRVPLRGGYLKNPNGTAVGLVFDREDQLLVALPGPPAELRPMVNEQLIPLLSKRFGTPQTATSLTMRFVGIGESSIDRIIKEYLVLPEDLVISSLFEGGRVDLTFALPSNSDAGRERLSNLEEQLLKHLGEYMYSDDGSTLEECIVRSLTEGGTTLAVAEIGSGGAVAAALRQAGDAQAVFKAGYVAPSKRAMARMLNIPDSALVGEGKSDRQTLHLMLRSLEARTGSGWNLVISELNREGDDTFLWTALSGPGTKSKITRIRWRGRGRSGQAVLVTRVLHQIWRSLVTANKLPVR